MKLPSLLPDYLKYTAVAENDTALYQMLVQVPPDMVDFVVNALEDETWCEEHAQFTRSILERLTRLAFEEKLSYPAIQQLAREIQKHYSVLGPFLPGNLECRVENASFPVNGLLLAAASPVFSQEIRLQCRQRNSQELRIEKMGRETFEDLLEFVQSGFVEDFWRKPAQQVMKEMQEVENWEVKGFLAICQEILKRYVNGQNAVEQLFIAERENLPLLRNRCFEVLNGLGRGVLFHEAREGAVSIEFLHFRDSAMDLFEKVRQLVSHVIVTGEVPGLPEFAGVLSQCPNLVGVNLSQTAKYYDSYETIPSGIQELDLSMCPWLNETAFSRMIEICPNVRTICLASNSQLPYTAWSHLRKLSLLETLDISRCSQIGNEEFLLILRACSKVQQLVVRELPKVTDSAIGQIGQYAKGLVRLDLSRTGVGNASLISIAGECKELRHLDISKCLNVTEEGILKLIEAAPSLEVLVIKNRRLSSRTARSLRDLRPYLEIRA